ncbi:MAG TPA: multiheme c-type cytochrome [Desulfohalobiaceae bacterium]|nr:multiheme c-type cytochrome [Desulfohalobiaceae bacterium]
MRTFWTTFLFLFFLLSLYQSCFGSDAPPISDKTKTCLSCHNTIHPGIVEDWQTSRHSHNTPKQSQQVQGLAKRISSSDIPKNLQKVTVGCAECHTLSPKTHKDSFSHAGFQVHTVVTPKDCALCHRQETEQYARNIMSFARKNLNQNPVYQDLQRTIHGTIIEDKTKIGFQPANDFTRAESCYYCHGTQLLVTGNKTRKTSMGPMQFPIIKGWPNQGSGRVNPDKSKGSCTACHTRHAFSIAEARKPYTCKECHIGPDVPAYKVYSASKHGNIFFAKVNSWNFSKVPWTVGQDFTAPTCAVCHMSLTVDKNGQVIAKRSHNMGTRLSWRIFGLIYAHPHPSEPDTTKLKNSAGLNLPTELNGQPIENGLIDPTQQKTRKNRMQAVCKACHGSSWVNNHWQRLQNTITQSNKAVKAATESMSAIWEKGLAQQNKSLFNEAIEKKWSNIWLINANKIRFASAMAGGGDYGVFAQGRFALSKKIKEMEDWFLIHRKLSQ